MTKKEYLEEILKIKYDRHVDTSREVAMFYCPYIPLTFSKA